MKKKKFSMIETVAICIGGLGIGLIGGIITAFSSKKSCSCDSKKNKPCSYKIESTITPIEDKNNK